MYLIALTGKVNKLVQLLCLGFHSSVTVMAKITELYLMIYSNTILTLIIVFAHYLSMKI